MSSKWTQKFEDFSNEIFNINQNIKHFALIDLEGHILVEKLKNINSFAKDDAEKIMFYHQLGTRRTKRDEFNDIYGETTYVHVQRKKLQQLVVYLPLVTIYLTISNTVKPNEIATIAKKVQGIKIAKLNYILNNVLQLGGF